MKLLCRIGIHRWSAFERIGVDEYVRTRPCLDCGAVKTFNAMTDYGMKMSFDKPPVWDAVCGAFQIRPEAYFTFGDTVYNPSRLPFPPEIAAHERVHVAQQKGNDVDAALWWGRYLRDPEFRVDQEARAYGKQYQFVCRSMKDRNQRSAFLHALAQSLSGPLYNGCVSHVEAARLIKQFSGVTP